MTHLKDPLAQVSDLLGALARVDRAQLSDHELVELLGAEEAVGRLLDTSRVLTAAEIAERSRYELGAEGLSMRNGQRKPVDFIEQVTRVSKAEAARRVRIGSAIRPRQSLLGDVLPAERPILGQAMVRGLVGVDTAGMIIYHLKQAAPGSQATPENMDAAELSLVEAGVTLGAERVADLGRAWRDGLDPDGIEPRYEEIRAHQLLTIGRERNGITRYTLSAGPMLSALIQAALQNSMEPGAGPRFLSDEDRARATTELVDIEGKLVERIVDPRPLGQKQYDILEGVFLAGLRATRDGASGFRTIGSVTAVIQLKDLEAGRGFGILEGTDEVLPGSAIQELACDTGFYQVVLGAKGEPLYSGMLLRYFTAAQRRAMIARDGDRCIAKGCKRRSAACHAHHVIFYSDDGPTDIDNGVLLCPAHHHALHQGAFELTMIDGMPWIRDGLDFCDDNAWTPASHNRVLGLAAV